jgi:hypothetical protein
MIEISRALARQFRAVLRRLLADQETRGPWPPVLCRVGRDGLILDAVLGEPAVRYQASGAHSPETLAFPETLLAECEGRTDSPVTLEPLAPGKGRASWTEGGKPREREFEIPSPERLSPFPELPQRFRQVSESLVSALEEAARTAGRDSPRRGLRRVLLRGKAGEVVATDGRQLLVQRGFAFPWSDEVLVPRLAPFAGRFPEKKESVAVGRTQGHVAVRVGPWTFLLALDTASKFPDFGVVIPRPGAVPTSLRLDPADVSLLATALPKLPKGDGDQSSVTLDLGTPPALRARSEVAGPVTEVVLTRSRVAGPPVRLCTNRSYLQRALKLGFLEVGLAGANKPLVCRDSRRIFVWMPLDQAGIIPTDPGKPPHALAVIPASHPSSPPERSKRLMPAQAPDPSIPDHDCNGNSPPERWGMAEVYTETEALQALLQDAGTRTARLLTALKHQRRQSRAVEKAMQSLRQVQLDR